MASFIKEFEHLEIKLEDIKSATNNFNENKVIGIGGFGKVYKGELSHSGGKSMVAIKRLDRKYGQGDPEFLKEIRMLSCYKHKNLISLLGFCKEEDEMILIYEHASNGSLDQILHDVTLTWTQRLKICIDAAEGLSFLHDPNGTQQRILHCDIKSANILLDENLNAKVADFGLSKISPANQKYTFLFTSPVGTPGYCDPLYMDTYQLTKESDVYSFGVVLFEVLCGRVCYEHTDGNFKAFVHIWKKCYKEKKLNEIILPYLNHQMEPDTVETFVDIAYQCLEKSRKQRPTMSVVLEKLKAALKLQEQEEKLKLLTINDKGEAFCERIRIEACLDQIQYDRLEYPSGFENSRFPGGRCYCKHKGELKVRVRARFLCPLIRYSVNLVFRNAGINMCKTLHYKLNGETKCCMVYDAYEREDRWFVVPLYQFTSDHQFAQFEINFERFRMDRCKLHVAGFEFRPIEETVELHDQGLEQYHDIVKAASQSLVYKSAEQLKELLCIGFHINNHTTWFSLNENGEHCEMLSIAHCLISREGGYDFNYYEVYSRFPRFLETKKKGFKVHIRTQYLTPSIGYTVNLVLYKGAYAKKQEYVALKYKLEGETETSIVYLTNTTKDNRCYIAELYQFTSNGRNFDLEIVFEDHKDYLKVEGILFQPLEKDEHEQVLEDEKRSDDSLQWTMKRGVFSCLPNTFYSQRRYAVDKDGKKSLIFSVRGATRFDSVFFQSSPESRFGDVAGTIHWGFKIWKKIKHGVLSPDTTYATYLIYKFPQHQSNFNGVLEIIYCGNRHPAYIYLVSPETPIIGQKPHNPLNRHKVYAIPRQRKDGWMEVKVGQLQTPSSTDTVRLAIDLRSPTWDKMYGLLIESIELRPVG